MEGQIIVSTNELRTQANAVKAQLSKMRQSFEDLKSQMSGTQAYWIGEAGDAHRRMYTGKLEKIEEVLRRYTEQVRDLEIMAGVYEEAEAQALSAADSLPASTLD